MSIKVKQLTKVYGTQKALNNVTFEVKKPEVVGFLGPNGAGKSTMMKILTTYINASNGEAFVNGYDVSTNTKEVQKSVGYLPEHNPLYLDMYVKEYLGFNSKVYGIKKERIEEVIELTGLTPEAHKTIGQLSKGQAPKEKNFAELNRKAAGSHVHTAKVLFFFLIQQQKDFRSTQDIMVKKKAFISSQPYIPFAIFKNGIPPIIL